MGTEAVAVDELSGRQWGPIRIHSVVKRSRQSRAETTQTVKGNATVRGRIATKEKTSTNTQPPAEVVALVLLELVGTWQVGSCTTTHDRKTDRPFHHQRNYPYGPWAVAGRDSQADFWSECGLTCLAVPHQEPCHVPTAKRLEGRQREPGRCLFLIQPPWSHFPIGPECGPVVSARHSAPPTRCLRLQQDDASSAEGACIGATKSRCQEAAAHSNLGWRVPRCQATTQSRSWVTRAEPVTTRMAAWIVSPHEAWVCIHPPHEGGTDTRVSETGGYLSFILLHKAPGRPSSVLSSCCPGARAGTASSFPVGPLGMYLAGPSPSRPRPTPDVIVGRFLGACHGGKGLPWPGPGSETPRALPPPRS